MSRQTPVITPSSESPVWRSISAFITRGLRSKEKHCVEMMLRLTHRYPERIILAERDDTNTCLCTDYMWKVHSKHQISGLFEVANLVIFGSEFQISQQSSVRTNETRSITRCFKKTDMLKEMDVSDSWGHVPARESWQLETTAQTKEGESKTCGSERALSIIHIHNHISYHIS